MGECGAHMFFCYVTTFLPYVCLAAPLPSATCDSRLATAHARPLARAPPPRCLERGPSTPPAGPPAFPFRWSAPVASSPSRAAAVLREQVHKPFHGFRAVPLGGGKPPRVLPRCALPSWGGVLVRDETRRYTRIPSTALLEYAFVAVATYYSRSTILDSETSEDDSVRMWPRRVTHVSHVEM
jgi:hypothetical protein